MQSVRFQLLSDHDIDLLAENSKNGNTKKSTNTWVKVFQAWCKSRNIQRGLESYSYSEKTELDQVLQRCYAEVRKQYGGDYEPDCLAVMQNGLQRHLKNNGCAYSINTDVEFKKSNEILEGKARQLRMEGKGKRPHATRPISHEEEEELWTKGRLGDGSPETLLHTMWYNNTQHFGLRARQEHHSMSLDNFRLSADDDGISEFIEFLEDPTKTRQYGLHPKKRVSTPKMFATNDNRCPVQLFKLYVSKRPLHLRQSGPFYLGIKPKAVMDDSVCYLSTQLGKNKISSIFKAITDGSRAALNGKKLANHSARKTSVKKMKKAGLPEESIIKITGHNSSAGLRSYDEGDEEEFRQLSNAIHGTKCTPVNSGRVQAMSVPSSSNIPNITSEGGNVFVNCQVSFNMQSKKRKLVIYDSSQE